MVNGEIPYQMIRKSFFEDARKGNRGMASKASKGGYFFIDIS